MSYGIKQPRIENYESEKAALEKYRLPDNEIITIRDSTGIYKLSLKQIGVPGAAFFNSSGDFISYLSDTITCNAGVSRFIHALARGAACTPDTNFSIDYFFDELVYSKDQKAVDREELDGRYDYYVLFFWTVYTGKLNKDKVYDWHTALEEEKRNGLSIRPYYVNLDCQEFWGYTREELPKFNY